MTRRGWLLFAAMGVLWGIPYLLIKVAVAELSPAGLVLARTLVGALLLVPVAGSRRELRPLLSAWRWVLAYTLIEIAIPWFLLADAERRLTSSLTGLLVAATPLVGAVLALFFQRSDRLDLRRIAGLALGILGVGFLAGFEVAARDLRAVAEVVLAAVCYATGPLIIALRLQQLPRLGVVAASLGITAMIYLPLALAQGAYLPRGSALVAVFLLALLCTAVAFLVFFALVAEVGAARSTVITYVNPAVAVVLGVVLLGEPLNAGILAGFVLILAGSFLATRRAGARDGGASPIELPEPAGS